MLFSVVLTGGCVLLIGCCFYLSSRKYRHYPGLGIPVLGDIYQPATTYTTSLPKLLKDLDKGFDKFGDTFCKWYGPAVVIATADPHLIDELSSHPYMADKEPMIYNSLYPVFNGAFSKSRSDKTWKMYRKTFVSSMNKVYLEKYHSVFVRRCLELVEALHGQQGDFDIQPYVMLMSLDVVAESLGGFPNFSILKERQVYCFDEFKRLNDVVMERILSFGLKAVDQKFAKTFKYLYPLFSKVLQDVKKKVESGEEKSKQELGYIPLIEEIIRPQLQKGATEEQVFRHLTETFLESFYTNGVIISGALVYLGAYPEVQEKVWAEQNELFGDTLDNPEHEDMKKMPYLDRVVKEAARLISAPCFPRRSKGDIKIGNHFIPKNSTVIYSFDRMRKDPRYWKTPNQFNPDHFLPEEVANRPKSAYIAFGIGIRNCPGYQYGLGFSRVAISTIVRHFKITSPLKQEELVFTPALFMKLNVPHTVSLKPRYLQA